ncbi:hypothetical protein KTF21_20600 [Burkholderia multivorans]|uniref:hypothetical protein n=1 Tax=Burkholderia multivorans TaxID=87883 RepID=UPI001C210B86|nr:hypothetical protein [Burkholderia multivorans]MBU9651083.1 hypothetical protein [Burkholderia multivorans]
MHTQFQEWWVRPEKLDEAFGLTPSETAEVIFMVEELRGLIDYIKAHDQTFRIGCEYLFQGGVGTMPVYVEDIERTVCLKLPLSHEGLLLESVRSKETSQLCLARYLTQGLNECYPPGRASAAERAIVDRVAPRIRTLGERRYVDAVIARG